MTSRVNSLFDKILKLEPTMRAKFQALLREQLDLEAKHRDLRKRIVVLLVEAYEQGQRDTILISDEDGKMYSLELKATKMMEYLPDEFGTFRLQGKAL